MDRLVSDKTQSLVAALITYTVYRFKLAIDKKFFALSYSYEVNVNCTTTIE